MQDGMKTRTFKEVAADYFDKLDLYTKAITRAHGDLHPEAHEVRELFAAIRAKVKKSVNKLPDLKDEFAQLRKITNHYKIPEDVCDTYAAVYHMLSEVDRAYHA